METIKYYEINEELAKRSHSMMSFSDYPIGSATQEYRNYVDKAYARADKASQDRPDESARFYSIADRYAHKLAENMNSGFRIGCMCPSVMICGPANFPVKKKEKQNAAAERNLEEWNDIQKSLDKMQSIVNGKDIILSDDDKAIEKLENKLQMLQDLQDRMKAANAYYRKNKTMEGCPNLTPEQIEKLKASMPFDWRTNPVPFESFQLSNNNQNIHSVMERLEKLKKLKSQKNCSIVYDGFKVVENNQDVRLQIFFDDKPNSEIRDLLKESGFRWAPSIGCWQRQLTSNAKYTIKRIVDEIREKL